MDMDETQVWRRVLAGGQSIQEPERVKALFREASEREALYRSLAGLLPAAGVLLREQQETVACLRGILALSGVRQLKLWFPQTRGDAGKLLTQAYPRALEALREYTSREGDPRFGPVYRRLANREEGQCARILTLLGGLETR